MRVPRFAAVAAAAVAAGAGADGDGCWVAGFTKGQCCNGIFGRRGNPYCWDNEGHTFDTCCNGEIYTPPDCAAFVSHFAFGAMGGAVDSLGKCADAMELHPTRCNAANTTAASCPICATISEHLPTYIRCVRSEQAGPGVTGELLEKTGGGAAAFVSGVHYPTLVRPRAKGREFTYAAPAFDAYVGAQLIGGGHWMPQEVAVLESLLPVGGIAVDAGANIGGFTLPFARKVGPRGQVHAFEPFRLTFQVLTANCALNGLISCHTHNKGLGSRPAQKMLKQPGFNAVGNPSKMYVADAVASELHIHYDRELEEEVEVVRLDDVPLRRLDLIKIDVESMELEMLQGGHGTIQRFRPVIYVEDSEADDLMNMRTPTKVMRLLAEQHGYSCINLAQSGLPDMTSLLCTPSERVEEVRRRIFSVDFSAIAS